MPFAQTLNTPNKKEWGTSIKNYKVYVFLEKKNSNYEVQYEIYEEFHDMKSLKFKKSYVLDNEKAALEKVEEVKKKLIRLLV